jgi:hypothetical protein
MDADDNTGAAYRPPHRQTRDHNNVDGPAEVQAVTAEQENPAMETTSLTATAIPADYTANTDAVPIGLNGAHRERYLALDRTQRVIYRYHYDVCGRLATHCYKLAIGENLWPAVPNERSKE